eukprot:TRINITY_DN43192_c0_g1_i1.p1 TRINITY_DN43192_c0_g1~~TRINITY_DN43192_c0_g1_i1.p1  ORF type:complete len:285 (-),score=29.52 TRINITY_DN43192_c0_g1_i1:218-1072(-)
MSRHASAVIGTEEVVEVDVYEMETYEPTLEDNALANAHLMNAKQARKRAHHVIVHEAQRRAARLAEDVAEYEISSPGLSYTVTLCSVSVYGGMGSEAETMASYPSARTISCDSASCGEASTRCTTKEDVPQPRDAPAKGRGWKFSTSTGILKRYLPTRTRVVPQSDTSEVQSRGESERHLRGPKTFCVRGKDRSITRRTGNEKRALEMRFDALFCDASTGSVEGHLDSFDQATSASFEDEPVLFGRGGRPVQRSPTSKTSFFGKSLSGFKAVMEKGRASVTPSP